MRVAIIDFDPELFAEGVEPLLKAGVEVLGSLYSLGALIPFVRLLVKGDVLPEECERVEGVRLPVRRVRPLFQCYTTPETRTVTLLRFDLDETFRLDPPLAPSYLDHAST